MIEAKKEKAIVVEELVCLGCMNRLDRCSHCGKEFKKDDTIYCEFEEAHYHKKCFDELVEISK